MNWLLIVILFGNTTPTITKIDVHGSEADCRAVAKAIEDMVNGHLFTAAKTACLPSQGETP